MAQPERSPLHVPQTVLDAFVAHALSELPNECCGFLVGRDRRVMAYLPLVNALASPSEFATEARSVLNAFRAMRMDRTELLAVCHSHPTSAPIPSRKDMDRNTYGAEVVWLIVGWGTSEPQILGWHLFESHYQQAEWVVAVL